MNTDNQNDDWSIVIKPKTKLFDLNFKELIRYRDLIMLFVKRDFVAYYQQALLGPFWYVLQPLVTTIVFTVIFGNIAKIPTDGIPQPIFYLCGLTLWNYFSICVTSTSNIFVNNVGLFGKVYFPRLTVPISLIMSNFIKFSIQFLLFLCFFVYFLIVGSAIKPNIYMLLVPLLLIQTAALALGFGIFVSSLSTKYRDLGFIIGFGMQLWMYATPVIYPASQITGSWKILLLLNPVAPIVELYRYAFLGSGTIDWFSYSLSIVTTLVLLFISVILFNKVEKSFMDKV